MVEPAVPELHAEQRVLRPVAAEQREGALRVGAEVHGGEQPRDGAARQQVVLWPVRGEQRYGDAALPQPVGEVAQVRCVAAVRAVLVLDLDEQDVAAPVVLPFHDGGQQDVEPAVHGGEVRRIAGPGPAADPGGQPARQAAVVPLGADVRARADDGPQPLAGRLVQEAGQFVQPPVAAAPGLVQVPRDVRLDSVQTHRAERGQAVRPLLRAGAEVVRGAGENPERAAVEPEAAGVVGQHALSLRQHPWADQGPRSGGSPGSLGDRGPQDSHAYRDRRPGAAAGSCDHQLGDREVTAHRQPVARPRGAGNCASAEGDGLQSSGFAQFPAPLG